MKSWSTYNTDLWAPSRSRTSRLLKNHGPWPFMNRTIYWFIWRRTKWCIGQEKRFTYKATWLIALPKCPILTLLTILIMKDRWNILTVPPSFKLYHFSKSLTPPVIFKINLKEILTFLMEYLHIRLSYRLTSKEGFTP